MANQLTIVTISLLGILCIQKAVIVTQGFSNNRLYSFNSEKVGRINSNRRNCNSNMLFSNMRLGEEVSNSSSTRREVLEKTVMVLSSISMIPRASSAITDEGEDSNGHVTIALTYRNDAYVISYRVSGVLFHAVVDTGSPFLMIPGSCAAAVRNKWGCYETGLGEDTPTGLEPTHEYFDGVEGDVQWRLGDFYFENAKGNILVPGSNTNTNTNVTNYSNHQNDSKQNDSKQNDNKLIFGVASNTLMAGPGGIFLGLVRDTDNRIRPSFLGQTNVKAFQLDFISNPRTLKLSTKPLLTTSTSPTNNDYIPLVNDLRKFGDPAHHYTARLSSITVNNNLLASDTNSHPIYAIFDTGVTGMVISRDLYDKRYMYATSNHEKSFWGHVQLSFQTDNGDRNITISANKPVTTPLGPLYWSKAKKFKGYIIVVGLSFLNDTRITVDIDEDQIRILS